MFTCRSTVGGGAGVASLGPESPTPTPKKMVMVSLTVDPREGGSELGSA